MVDDEQEFLELMQSRLTKRGFSVLTAIDGSQALAKVAKNLKGDPSEMIDVIIMDVRMPGMDGLVTLREMQKIAPQIPVILLTGHAAVGVATEGLELGAFDYMLKPVQINDLINKMEEAVQG